MAAAVLLQFGELWRTPPEPTLYPEHIFPPIEGVDVPLVTGASVVVLLMLSSLAALPGFHLRRKQSVLFFGAAAGFLGLMLVLFAGFFGMGWYAHTIRTRTPFRAFDNREVVADIGLHVGLEGINVTMRGVPRVQLGHHIDYEEHFEWDGPLQGRLGFGPNAGRIFQEFRESQFQGVPTPIQHVAEWFILDGEGARWGRYYRMGGYYCQQFLYVAAFSYVGTALLYFIGAYRVASWGLVNTGVWLVSACVVNIRVSERLVNKLRIPFPDAVLEPKPSWTFWWVLTSGVFCLVAGGAGIVYLRVRANTLRTRERRDLTVAEAEDEAARKHDRSFDANYSQSNLRGIPGSGRDLGAADGAGGGGAGDQFDLLDPSVLGRVHTFQRKQRSERNLGRRRGGNEAVDEFDAEPGAPEPGDDDSDSDGGGVYADVYGDAYHGASSRAARAAVPSPAPIDSLAQAPSSASSAGLVAPADANDVELAEAAVVPQRVKQKNKGKKALVRIALRVVEIVFGVFAFSAAVADKEKRHWLTTEWGAFVTTSAVFAVVHAGVSGVSDFALSWCATRLRTTPAKIYVVQVFGDTIMSIVCFSAACAAVGEKYDDYPAPGVRSHEDLSRPFRDTRHLNGNANAIITAHFVASFAFLASLAMSHKIYTQVSVRALRQRALRNKRL